VDTRAVGFALDRYQTALNGLVRNGRDSLVGTTDATSRKRCLLQARRRRDQSGAGVVQLIDEATGQEEGSCADRLRTARRRFLAATRASIPLTRAITERQSARVFERLDDLHRSLTGCGLPSRARTSSARLIATERSIASAELRCSFFPPGLEARRPFDGVATPGRSARVGRGVHDQTRLAR
jgi:hypothetical protein